MKAEDLLRMLETGEGDENTIVALLKEQVLRVWCVLYGLYGLCVLFFFGNVFTDIVWILCCLFPDVRQRAEKAEKGDENTIVALLTEQVSCVWYVFYGCFLWIVFFCSICAVIVWILCCVFGDVRRRGGKGDENTIMVLLTEQVLCVWCVLYGWQHTSLGIYVHSHIWGGYD